MTIENNMNSKTKALYNKYHEQHEKISAMTKETRKRIGKSNPKSFANGKHWTTDDIPR